MAKNGISSHYLLVAATTETLSGHAASAERVIQFRLSYKRWPLYKGTRCVKQLAPGDSVLIYAARFASRPGLVTHRAVIERVVASTPRYDDIDAEKFLAPTSVGFVHLTEIYALRTAVNLRSILEKLDCCPKNLDKWGAILQGGIKPISKNDFGIIVKASSSK